MFNFCPSGRVFRVEGTPTANTLNDRGKIHPTRPSKLSLIFEKTYCVKPPAQRTHEPRACVEYCRAEEKHCMNTRALQNLIYNNKRIFSEFPNIFSSNFWRISLQIRSDTCENFKRLYPQIHAKITVSSESNFATIE